MDLSGYGNNTEHSLAVKRRFLWRKQTSLACFSSLPYLDPAAHSPALHSSMQRGASMGDSMVDSLRTSMVDSMRASMVDSTRASIMASMMASIMASMMASIITSMTASMMATKMASIMVTSLQVELLV